MKIDFFIFLRTRTIILDIDSRFRDDIDNTSSGQFTTHFDRRFTNVISARINSAVVPFSFYTVEPGCNTLQLSVDDTYDPHTLTVTIGTRDYTPSHLVDELMTAAQEAFGAFVFNFSYDEKIGKVKVATFRTGNYQNFENFTIYSAYTEGSTTDKRFDALLGLGREDFSGVRSFSYIPLPHMMHLYGKTDVIYLTIAELFTSNTFTSNCPKLRMGIMAKIPVKYEAGESRNPIEYSPTETQMYICTYTKPICFDQLTITAFALVGQTTTDPDGYYILDFNGQDISLTVEIVIVDED